MGKNGGARPGAGRPRKPKPSVPEPSAEVNWAEVERFANVGATEEAIVAGLGITPAQLKEPAVAEKLRQLVARGNAKKDLLLLEQIDAVGRGEKRGGGNTLALEARNRLGWDKQTVDQAPKPDLTSAAARLRLTCEKVAKKESEETGSEVTPAAILLRVAFGDEFPKAKVH